jgi:hypothetical protein
LALVLFLLIHSQLSAWNLCNMKMILFVWPTWLYTILTPCYLWLEIEFRTLCLFFLAFLLYYVSIFLFIALNSRVAIVLFSFKFNFYCNRVCYSLLVKLLWNISSWLACNVLPMATFHVVRKLIFTILVGDSIVVKVIKNVLCAMFPFWKGSMHTFKDFAYMEDIIVSSPIY